MKKREYGKGLKLILAVRLHPETAHQLRAVSRSHGLSVSSIVRELIVAFLEGRAPHFNREAKDAGKNRDT